MNASVLILPATLLAWMVSLRRGCGWREAALRSLTVFGAAVAVLTEALSPFGLLRRGPVLLCWCVVCAAAALPPRRRSTVPRSPVRLRAYRMETALAVAVAAVAVVIGLTAVVSPPNSADTMAYHLPRVVYWVQAGSVRFFPSDYLNQIMLQPLAEYTMLHTYLLSGGDHWVNLVQFLGFLGSVAGVSLIAETLGAGPRGQALAAVFCATLPNGILQASGAKNDYLLACWLVAAVYFLLRSEHLFFGAALGLALATKGTAYLFAPPLLAVLLARLLRRDRRAARAAAVAGVLGILAINGPQYARNLQLSGSVLGFDSAQGDGFYRWRNEKLGWRAAVSNVLRNTADQLGARSPAWNQGVYRAVARAHTLLGLNPDDPNSTWPWTRYEPPRNTNHEANANNRWHLLLLCLALIPCWLAFLRKDARWLFYSAGLAAGFLAFCFYLKWQMYLARLELPLFVLASPVAGFAAERLRSGVLQAALCLFLLNNSRPYLFQNWTRPLKGADSLLRTARDDNYFRDMSPWHNTASFRRAVDLTAASGCARVGIDTSHFQLEYPYQALLLEKNPRVRFVHVGVENASRRYADPHAPPPCVVFCPDCAGDAKKLREYAAWGRPVVLDRFLLWTR